jgi:hypothetical protein
VQHVQVGQADVALFAARFASIPGSVHIVDEKAEPDFDKLVEIVPLDDLELREVDRRYAIDQLPVFVKAGSILPMQPPMLYTGARAVDPLTLSIAPLADGQTSHYTVYEDSGHAEDYQRNIDTT